MSVTAIVGKCRLLQLAELLENLPPERFDYSTWVGEDWKGKADLSCGTTGCALGWATTIPSLRKAGLRMRAFLSGNGGYVVLLRNGRKVAESEKAAEEVFGISNKEAIYLFNGTTRPPEKFEDKLKTSPDWDATPKQVAKHIKRFVKVKFPD